MQLMLIIFAAYNCFVGININVCVSLSTMAKIGSLDTFLTDHHSRYVYDRPYTNTQPTVKKTTC